MRCHPESLLAHEISMPRKFARTAWRAEALYTPIRPNLPKSNAGDSLEFLTLFFL